MISLYLYHVRIVYPFKISPQQVEVKLSVGELLKNRKGEKEIKAKTFSVAYLKTHIIVWLALDMCLNFQHVFKFKGFAQLKLMCVRKAKPDLV